MVSLVQSNLSNTYTNTVTIPAAAAPGSQTVYVTVTDNSPLSGSTPIVLTITTTSEVWNGGGGNGNANWSTGANWVGGYPPAYVGDSVAFASTSGSSSPNMDNSYTVSGLSFNSGAPSFTITTANSSSLTLNGNVVNNSAARRL